MGRQLARRLAGPPATDRFTGRLSGPPLRQVDEFVRVGEEGGRGPSSHLDSGGGGGAGSPSSSLVPDRTVGGRCVLARSFELGPGCVVGSTDFYLARPHATRALCRSPTALVLRVTRSGAHVLCVCRVCGKGGGDVPPFAFCSSIVGLLLRPGTLRAAELGVSLVPITLAPPFPSAAMARMAAEAPQALNVLQAAVMRANTLDLSQAAEQQVRAPHS